MAGRRFWRVFAAVSAVIAATGLSVGDGRAEPERLISFSPGIGQVGPQGALARGADGTLYAATYGLGANGRGAVFSLSPPATPGGPWALGVVHAFDDPAGGRFPRAGVTLGPGGELYGTTFQGGGNDRGVAFRLTPPATPGDPWTKDILHEFGFSEAGNPSSDLLLGPDGALFGVTEGGGPANCGVAYRLTPRSGGRLPWVYKTLARFTSSFGCAPRSKLSRDAEGNLYGSLFNSGPAGLGGIFRLGLLADGTYKLAKLKVFNGANGLGNPMGGLALEPSGALVGAARNGGAYGCGGVFRLTPPAPGQTKWSYQNVKVLPGGSRSGCFPVGVGQAPDGTLAVSTYQGGVFNVGALLELTPAASGPSPYTISVRESFGPTYNYPQGTPVFGPAGEVYGSTTDAISIWRSAP